MFSIVVLLIFSTFSTGSRIPKVEETNSLQICWIHFFLIIFNEGNII